MKGINGLFKVIKGVNEFRTLTTASKLKITLRVPRRGVPLGSQWLGLCPFTTGGTGLIPGLRNKISLASGTAKLIVIILKKSIKDRRGKLEGKKGCSTLGCGP